MKKKTRRPAARKTKAAPRRARRAAARPQPKRAAKAAARGPKLQYIGVFEREFPITLKVMKAYPSGQDEFRPHDRSTTASRLAHTFSMHNGIAIQAIRGELHMPPEFPPAPATYADAVANYERGARELLGALKGMPESRLSETVDFFTGPGQVTRVPVGEILWLMLLDSIHHRGQLSVYIRMAGGRVPAIYGPSADEPWM